MLGRGHIFFTVVKQTFNFEVVHSGIFFRDSRGSACQPRDENWKGGGWVRFFFSTIRCFVVSAEREILCPNFRAVSKHADEKLKVLSLAKFGRGTLLT